MEMMISIDPGEVHNGVALWIRESVGIPDDELGLIAPPWKLIDVFETDPVKLVRWVLNQLRKNQGAQRTLVIEEFRLYPWMAREQSFSGFETVETIGVLKYLGRITRTTVIMQPASIKKPMEGILRNRGIELIRKGRHAMDAQLHGYYKILH